LTREDLVNFYNQFYKNGKLVIFMAGKFPNTTIDLLNKHIGSLPLNATTIPDFNHPIIAAQEKSTAW